MKQKTSKEQAELFLIRRIIPHFTLLFLPYISCNHESSRVYTDGDVILGGLFELHFAGYRNHCGEIFTLALGEAETMIFAIDSINNNCSLLPNVTLGYDIRDSCESMALTMEITYDLVRDGDPVCMCNSNMIKGSDMGNTTEVGSKPISALAGPTNSGSAVLLGSLLQVSNIPAISPTASSVELSSRSYKNFFRAVAPDTWQAKAVADIIELFNWTYVAAVGVDTSYGRNGIWALERESYDRKSFCVAFSEFIPRLNHQEKIKQIVTKIKLQPSIGVLIT